MGTFLAHRRIGISAVAVVAAMLVLVAAGCGGSSKKSSGATTSTAAMTTTSGVTTSGSGGTVSVNDWANGFCSAVGNWANSMKSVGKNLRGNPTKSNLQGSVATIKNANQTLVASLQSLGTPDTPGGAQAKAAIDQLATTLKSHSDQIGSAITGMSGAGATGLRTAGAAISTNLIAMGNAFKSSISQLQSLSKQAKGSFKQAFNQSSACQKIKREGA